MADGRYYLSDSSQPYQHIVRKIPIKYKQSYKYLWGKNKIKQIRTRMRLNLLIEIQLTSFHLLKLIMKIFFFATAFANRNPSGPSACFAEQLKQVLAEREMRASTDGDNSTNVDDGSKGTYLIWVFWNGYCLQLLIGSITAGMNSQFIWQPAIQNSPQSSVSSGSLSPGHIGSENASGSTFGSTGEFRNCKALRDWKSDYWWEILI